MNVAIVKYNAGNIRSVDNALRRVGVEPVITADPEILSKADKVIFPGQGEASTTMAYLREHKLDVVIKGLTQPVLGVCIGMQLMCKHSEEYDTDCLGIFDANVIKFKPEGNEYKVPQMGWNSIENLRSDLFKGFEKPEFVYFIHSYYVENNPNAIATTNYIHDYCSAMHKDNFYATQFHPEKSGAVGERILRNFLDL